MSLTYCFVLLTVLQLLHKILIKTSFPPELIVLNLEFSSCVCMCVVYTFVSSTEKLHQNDYLIFDTWKTLCNCTHARFPMFDFLFVRFFFVCTFFSISVVFCCEKVKSIKKSRYIRSNFF